MFTPHSNRKAQAGGTAAELERVNKRGLKKHSNRMRTARLPTVHALAATRCQHLEWGSSSEQV